MKNSTKIIIGLLTAALITVGVLVIPNLQKAPAKEYTSYEKLIESLKKQSEIKKIDMDVTIGMNIEGEDSTLVDIDKILNDVEFKYNIKKNVENIEAPLIEGLFSIMYMDESALKLEFFLNEQEMIFGLPTVIDQKFILSYEEYSDYMNIVAFGKNIPSNVFNFKEMIKKSYEFQKKLYSLEGIAGAESFDNDKYNVIIENGLKNLLATTVPFEITLSEKDKTKTLKCDGFLLSFNETQFIDFLIPVLEEAKNDESVKNIVIAKLEDYYNFSMELYGNNLTGSGIENPYADLEKFIENIRMNYKSGMDDLIVELKTQREKSDEEIFTATIKIGLDDNGIIRYTNTSMEINNSLLETMSKDNNVYIEESTLTKVNKIFINTETIVNSYNQDIEFTDYANVNETGVKIINLIKNPNAPETQQVIMQLYGALMQEMATNPLFQAISQEIGVY